MLTKPLSDKDKKSFIMILAKAYMRSKRRIQMYKFLSVEENKSYYSSELSTVYLVNSTILLCSPTSQFILKNEFFSYPNPNWYIEYYSRSSYYRLKKQAIDEFIDCLNI
ncbi:MG284/MPN403 family protein [Anaerorhabdus furcosa]|uniref:Uncharacterized protein n=1 Tax=Anaerorhabdus furcosa TaxID=118967 RepID=A0A1T4NY18_9FIRM|nr:hypothetical protein [Anaerorhabdus furcosa]SJZ83947.1 hypothetical protein SAMN02745191_1779 [Anaerorhabdus furcosa]